MNTTTDFNCKGCNRDTHPSYMARYGGYCLECENAGVPHYLEQIDGLQGELKQATDALAALRAELADMTADRDSESRWAKQYHDNWVGVCNTLAGVEGSLRLTTEHLRRTEQERDAARAELQTAQAFLADWLMGDRFAELWQDNRRLIWDTTTDMWLVQSESKQLYRGESIGDALAALAPAPTAERTGGTGGRCSALNESGERCALPAGHKGDHTLLMATDNMWHGFGGTEA